MVNKVVFATGNEGKMREIRDILKDVDIELFSAKQVGMSTDVEENGSTFMENALIKARAGAKEAGCMVLADDSGLEIDYLNKEPGIYSARYMGEDTSYDIKNANLLERMEGVPEEQRTARFVCAIAAVTPEGEEYTCLGTIEGRVAYESKGVHGFGYDPIFYVPELGCTTGEIPEAQKNKISHRGRALTMMREKLVKEGIWAEK